VTSEEATDLLNLQCLWRDAYAIAFHDGVWSARRRDHPAACGSKRPAICLSTRQRRAGVWRL
jgi:hypothetical protein